jgi:hypothetical protein
MGHGAWGMELKAKGITYSEKKIFLNLNPFLKVNWL